MPKRRRPQLTPVLHAPIPSHPMTSTRPVSCSIRSSKGSSPVTFGSMSFSSTAPSRRVALQVPLISLASKDHQKPQVVHRDL